MNTLPFEFYQSYDLGDMKALFFKADERMMFALLPTGTEEMIPPHRRDLNDTLGYLGCRRIGGDSVVAHPDSMIQFHLLHDKRSMRTLMRNSGTVSQLKFIRQEQSGETITTVFRDSRGFEAEQTLRYHPGEHYIEINTSVINRSSETAELGMLESFTLNLLSPFHIDDAPDALKLHRYHSFWTGEGREEITPVEDLELCQTWSGGYARGIRFGQRSSMIVREYFPTIGLEDTAANVTWAAQLATVSPWQMTLCRDGDFLSMGGGLPDFEFADFRRKLAPGERYSGIPAIVTVVRGDMQKALNRLTEYPVNQAVGHPRSEERLPVIFNEFCTTWGAPTEAKLKGAIEKLHGLNIGYFVLDAGWFRNPETRMPGIGDWEIFEPNYPEGFDTLLERIRKAGMIPGIWFEFENVSANTKLFQEHPDWLVTWEGRLYEIDADRYFLDFRKKEVLDYLEERVIDFLRNHNIGYMKVDYNGSFDLADSRHGSAAAGVQEVLASVRAFYLHLRKELPDLVLEICASGGYRLSAEWMRIGDMASFSDCHEGVAAPIIAGQTALQIPFTANQVWATLRSGEKKERTVYQIACGFLGRLCISGDAMDFSEFQLEVIRDGIEFYEECLEVLKRGSSRLEQHLCSRNYNTPKGYQVFRRTSEGRELLVLHTFGNPPPLIRIRIEGKRVVRMLKYGLSVETLAEELVFSKPAEFAAAVLLLTK